MTWTAVKRKDGSSLIVSNTVKDAGGGSQVVLNDALDTGTGIHTIFGTTVTVTPVAILNFKLFDNRIFKL